MPKIPRKSNSLGKFVLSFLDERIQHQEQKLWAIFWGQIGPKTFWDCDGQGCHIISVNTYIYSPPFTVGA
jgi:hypothetical protein